MCASYFASIFGLHNSVDPQIPKSNGNRASAITHTGFYFVGKSNGLGIHLHSLAAAALLL